MARLQIVAISLCHRERYKGTKTARPHKRCYAQIVERRESNEAGFIDEAPFPNCCGLIGGRLTGFASDIAGARHVLSTVTSAVPSVFALYFGAVQR